MTEIKFDLRILKRSFEPGQYLRYYIKMELFSKWRGAAVRVLFIGRIMCPITCMRYP